LTPQLNGPYCFDAGSEILRISFLNQGTISIKSNNPAVFQGHSLPGDLEVVQDDKLVLSAHLESIEPVTPADESTFIPPPDATLLQPIKLVTTKENENSFWGAGAAFSAAGSGPASISPGVATGMLISRTAPAYPAVAKAARVQGTVVLEARISKQGHIESLRIISGPPLLQQAALDTVKDWTYRPYLLNGSPVEVLTTVNVIFTLGDTPAKPK
jgi:TonB family protein